MKKLLLPGIIIILILVGCGLPKGQYSSIAGSDDDLILNPTQYQWEAEPSKVENEHISITITPAVFIVKMDGYIAFDLNIINKTKEDITLDWNKTLYIENGKTKGGFMFEGVVYRDRYNNKPPDIIFAESKYNKIIMPNLLVTFKYSHWLNTPMPEGRNGIYLTLKIKDKEISEKLLIEMYRVSE